MLKQRILTALWLLPLMLARRAVQAPVQRIQTAGTGAQLTGRQRQLHGRLAR